MTHWCRDVQRDIAVRAAEDGRQGPLPTLEEAIERAFGFDAASAQRACDEVKSWPEDVQKDCRFVLGDLLEQGVERLQALVTAWRFGKEIMKARYPEMMPKSASGSSAAEQENKANGMRTERITLEVTHDLDAPLGGWIVQVIDESLGFDEYVRVVEESAPPARGWLTEEEREAVQCVLPFADDPEQAKTLTMLLARSSPPEVVLPVCESTRLSTHMIGFLDAIGRVKQALADAGVKVTEGNR